MAASRDTNRDLREACIEEALSIIDKSGVEGLSLREVARRLGVSHQAPYKHFPSRDHILAAVVAQAFDDFARYLDARPRTGDPRQDLGEMGRAYLRYSQAHPLQYRLMFGTPLPDPGEHPEMMQTARHAFTLLRDCVKSIPADAAELDIDARIDLDALFIWSTVHGLSSILQSRALDTLNMPPERLAAAAAETLKRIGFALEASRRGEPNAESKPC